MMKTIFDIIFAKNTRSSFVSTSRSAENVQKTRVQAAGIHKSTPQKSNAKVENVQQANSNQQTYNLDDEFKNIAFENAYEVAEISLDEFKYTGPERRKFPRKPGETRSCYSKNNNAAQSSI